MWTDELIARLQKYVEYKGYIVMYCEAKVVGIEPRQPQYGPAGWPAYFLEGNPDEPYVLEDTQPKDFSVFAIRPDWTESDPMMFKRDQLPFGPIVGP